MIDELLEWLLLEPELELPLELLPELDLPLELLP